MTTRKWSPTYHYLDATSLSMYVYWPTLLIDFIMNCPNQCSWGHPDSDAYRYYFFRQKACNTWHNHVDVWAVSYYIGEIMVDFYKDLHFHFRGTVRKCGNSSVRIGSTRTPTRCPDGPQSSRTLSRTPSKTNLTTLTSHSSEDRGSSLCYRTHQQGKRSLASNRNTATLCEI